MPQKQSMRYGVVLNTRVPYEDAVEVDKEADSREITRSKMLAVIVHEWLEERKKDRS